MYTFLNEKLDFFPPLSIISIAFHLIKKKTVNYQVKTASLVVDWLQQQTELAVGGDWTGWLEWQTDE